MTASDRQVLVLHHSEGADQGWLEEAFDEARIDRVMIRLGSGEAIPGTTNWRGVVSLGGVMGAYEEDTYPFLSAEKQFLTELVREGVPVLGICLGCQLLADALGGTAYQSPAPEAGFLSMTMTDAGRNDPVIRAVPDRVLVSHGDTFDLPPGAELLAHTDQYRHAFRLGSALAVQFHPEAGPAMVEGWLRLSGGRNIAKAGVDPEALVAEMRAGEDLMKEQALRFFATWLTTL